MKHLRYWRKQAGMKVAELAQEINISEVTLWRWERDKSNPNAQDIQKLCKALNVTEAELLNGPSKKQWELDVIFGEPKKEVADLTSNLGNAVVAVGDIGMSIKLVGPNELWYDNDKFEELIKKIRKTRDKLLKFNTEDDD